MDTRAPSTRPSRVWPIAWPIARILDAVLGSEGTTRFNRAEIVTLAKIHSRGKDGKDKHHHEHKHGVKQQEGASVEDLDQLHECLRTDEVDMVQGVLQLREIKASEKMCPMDKVDMLSCEDHMDMDTMDTDEHHRTAVQLYACMRARIACACAVRHNSGVSAAPGGLVETCMQNLLAALGAWAKLLHHRRP